MKVAIAGATGLTGNLCLQQLLLHPEIEQVISIGRKYTGLQHKKLSEVLLVQQQLPVPVYADAFICCLGTTIKKAGSSEAFIAVDLGLPLYLAKQLQQNGCTVAAVISSMGADISSSFLYTRTKGQLEEGLKKMGFQSLSILRPSIIDGERNEKRFGEKAALLVMKLISPLLFGSSANYKPIKASEIAQALVNLTIERKKGTTIYLSKTIKPFAFIS
jgi:uncharacterized protein YbjT (DUF2867 family)